MKKYIIAFLISMVPVIELRGAVPIAQGMGIHPAVALVICVIGNMVPVPFIYFFARRFLMWGSQKRYIGGICRFFVTKGERAGEKLGAKGKKSGLFMAILLFVGVPIPGTGAWTGTLAASFLDVGFKPTVLSVSLGVILCGIIMAVISALGLHIFGL